MGCERGPVGGARPDRGRDSRVPRARRPAARRSWCATASPMARTERKVSEARPLSKRGRRDGGGQHAVLLPAGGARFDPPRGRRMHARAPSWRRARALGGDGGRWRVIVAERRSQASRCGSWLSQVHKVGGHRRKSTPGRGNGPGAGGGESAAQLAQPTATCPRSAQTDCRSLTDADGWVGARRAGAARNAPPPRRRYRPGTRALKEIRKFQKCAPPPPPDRGQGSPTRASHRPGGASTPRCCRTRDRAC